MSVGKDPEEAASLRFFGRVLQTLAVIALVLCGSCTGWVLFWGVVAAVSGQQDEYLGRYGLLQLALLFGVPPILAAAAALWFGTRLVRQNPVVPTCPIDPPQDQP